MRESLVWQLVWHKQNEKLLEVGTLVAAAVGSSGAQAAFDSLCSAALPAHETRRKIEERIGLLRFEKYKDKPLVIERGEDGYEMTVDWLDDA